MVGPTDTSINSLLQLEEIEHRTTQVRRPQIRRIRPCNGFVERFQRTLLDEHFRIQGRKKFYETLTEMQIRRIRP